MTLAIICLRRSTRWACCWELPGSPCYGAAIVDGSWRLLDGHRRAVWAVDWARTPDGRLLLASGSYDETVRIWDAATWECVQVLEGHDQPVASVRWAVAPDGGLLLASGDDDGIVRIWDAHTWQCRQVLIAGDAWQGRPPLLHRLRRPPPRLTRIRSLAWIQGGEGELQLVTSSYDQTIRTWDAASWRCQRILTSGTGSVTSHVTSVAAATIADGRRLLASGALDRDVRIWDQAAGECIRVLECDAEVLSVAWGRRANGRLLLAAGCDRGTVRIWDADTWECMHVLHDHTDVELPTYGHIQTTSLAWMQAPDPDGALLLTGLNLFGRRIHQWDGEHGELRRSIDLFSALGRADDSRGRYLIALAWAEPTASDRTLRLAVGAGPDVQLCIWEVRASAE
jgi:WD40 repeat protein